MTGSEAGVRTLIDKLQSYGIREVARTGSVAISREHDLEVLK
jgi:acetolactate synthase small subunit